MTSEKSNSVKLTFSPESAVHHGQHPGSRRGRETLAIKYQGKDLAIAFNPAPAGSAKIPR